MIILHGFWKRNLWFSWNLFVGIEEEKSSAKIRAIFYRFSS